MKYASEQIHLELENWKLYSHNKKYLDKALKQILETKWENRV